MIPFFDKNEFYLKIEDYIDKNPIIIIDDKIINFDSILKKYKENMNFIVLSDEKYENIALNLNNNVKVEDLIKEVKNYFLSQKGSL